MLATIIAMQLKMMPTGYDDCEYRPAAGANGPSTKDDVLVLGITILEAT